MATYPGAAKSFTTRTTGQTIQPGHVNDLQDEVTAIEQDLVAGLAVARGGTGATSQTTGFDNLAPGTTKGDLIVYDGSNHVRVAVGTDAYVLSASAAAASGVAWIPRGGIAGYSNATYSTQLTRTSATGWLDTNLSTTYTPTSASNLLLVCVSMPIHTATYSTGQFRLRRAGTAIRTVTTPGPSAGVLTWTLLLGASSTSAQVFDVQFQYQSGTGGAVYSCYDNQQADIAVIEFAV